MRVSAGLPVRGPGHPCERGPPGRAYPGETAGYCVPAGPACPHLTESTLYFTDRGIEELEKRRGEEEVTFEWLAEQLRTFVDLNPDFEVPVERLATWLARLDDEDDEE
ncbi:hypothetical protein SAV14893_022410 [Streptomyces avermitilis]|uniref:Uncharacterized protein n=2 Tax=Streptomyces avermitilis TaxID=33903 RepID=Q82J07_STRAW|nr:hypothetical protein SAVERM_2975 [Streptomyces avermitilis MA-4680 = NBRC 14893]BBJ50821.1 hypothetical protein SAVMC3_34500 [Streptomyces avermitilis]GDY62848.1 hypothetical protein SAV14893_022410 [Streptomyces avermitilis]GDY77030.1 hypothetical protein SAV31267_065150 [Streptomyces avermitilis]GDY85943.1 hypothetical protein SAVCW2_51420 [Streptomyces avermitilis]